MQGSDSAPENVLVIGGSSGIGATIAQLCEERGHTVATAQRRHPEWLRHRHHRLDLRDDYPRVKRVVEEACVMERVRWLVLAGGVGAFNRPLYSPEQVDEVIATNFTGQIAAVQGALTYWLRHRKEIQGTLRILLIGSTSSHNPSPKIELYAAAKAGAAKFIEEVGRRYAGRGVRANELRAGWAKTPMTEAIEPELWQAIVNRIPLARAAEPEEVAQLAYSVLDGPDYMTANVVTLSGGL